MTRTKAVGLGLGALIALAVFAVLPTYWPAALALGLIGMATIN